MFGIISEGGAYPFTYVFAYHVATGGQDYFALDSKERLLHQFDAATRLT